MGIQLRATLGNQAQDLVVEVDKYPDACPICHHAIQPKFMGDAHAAGRRNDLQLIFQCPVERCQRFFISTYSHRQTGGYFYSGSAPFLPEAIEFPDHISSISPMFCAIFTQARNAENADWKLIAGPGYRKALEFLLKDYLSKLKTENAEKIKSMLLGSCIETFVDNEKIKQMAKRAAWLGNDETHYVRKWEDKDLEDLKSLIQVTVHWIEMEAITNKILSDMPEGKK